jgi:putative flippase GtrA
VSWQQYARFLTIGGLVGLLTIGVRELVGSALPGDGPLGYSVSIVIAYCVGILSSFELNRRFTFRSSAPSQQRDELPSFIACAIVGLVVTWALSLLLRYGLALDAAIGRLARPVAFATATLLASLLTYFLNARFVFRSRPAANAPYAP